MFADALRRGRLWSFLPAVRWTFEESRECNAVFVQINILSFWYIEFICISRSFLFHNRLLARGSIISHPKHLQTSIFRVSI